MREIETVIIVIVSKLKQLNRVKHADKSFARILEHLEQSNCLWFTSLCHSKRHVRHSNQQRSLIDFYVHDLVFNKIYDD